MKHSYLAFKHPIKILAHRGFTFVSGKPALDENTFAAFDAAVAAGASYLEIDVRATKDLVPVVFHDKDLARTAGIAGEIQELSLLELQKLKLRHGGTVPSLDQVLDHYPDLKFNIDIKSKAAVIPTANLINSTKSSGRILLTSFSDSRRNSALALCPGVATSPGGFTVLRIWLKWKMGFTLEKDLKLVNVLQIPVSYGPIRLDSPRFIEAVSSYGVEVHYWTINDVEEAKRLVSIGAHGIVTDRTDLMVAAL